jgi:serine/threonine protein kinase
MAGKLVGQQIEHYRIEGVIGKGGMGTVYRAMDVNLARPVAIKVMHDQYSRELEFQQRFQQEAQASARLEHPSIVGVYHFGREQGLLYLVMELVPGLSLGAYMKQLAARQQVIRLDETILLMAQVADALGYAHRKGVIHRDVKPDNIIVKQLNQAERPDEPPLRAVMTDFGLAKLVEGGVETKTGEFFGTLAYISPEQIMDAPLDGRSDIYALGIVLFQLATGELPFNVRTPSEALKKHMEEPPPSPRSIQPGVPEQLEQIILKALSKRPEDRYQTGEEMGVDLRQVSAELGEEEALVLPESEQSSVVSMVIELDSNPNLADTDRWLGDEEVKPPGYDRLLISREGEEPEVYVLYKRTFTIGRSQGNDIVLVGNKVSRWHARLEFAGGSWHILDSDSTNGTYLQGKKLAPDELQVWTAEQTARIGPFFLRLETPSFVPKPMLKGYEEPVRREREVIHGRQPAAAAVAGSASARERITADMRPRQLKGAGICRVLLLNKGDARMTLMVSAADSNGRIYFDGVSKQLSLSPGQKGVVDFYMEAQRRPLIGRRQTLPFTMHVNSSKREWERLDGELLASPMISIWLILTLLLFFLAVVVAIVLRMQILS